MIVLGIDGRLANEEERSGAGRFCRELLYALGFLTDCGVRLRVYLDRPPISGFDPRRATLITLPAGRFWTHRLLARELRQSPPDVFFSPVAQLPVLCPCPAIVTVLDLASRTHPESFPAKKRIAMRVQADHAIPRASRLLAISEATARDVVGAYGVPRARISVAYPGCAEEFFEAKPQPSGTGTILDSLPERYVLHLGQVQPRKNLERLMAAYARVCRRHPGMPHDLVIAGGQGWRNEEIYRAARTSPVAHRIHYFDFLPDYLIPPLVAGADVLALVSLSEGFGLPALEAMAAGTAVLASNSSSLPEVVGDAGVLVDPLDTEAIADGLERLLYDAAQRMICEELGRARARRFTWEKTAQIVADAALQLAGPRTGDPD